MTLQNRKNITKLKLWYPYWNNTTP